MAKFTTNSTRLDPYKNFKFQVKIPKLSGDPVAGLSKCSGLKKTTELIEWREAGDPSHIRKLTGRTNYQPITLEAGLTHDTTFETWANKVNTLGADAAMSLKTYRQDLVIDVMNEMGTTVLSYKVYRAWVAEYQAMPDLDSNGKAVAITSIKIEHEGFERDVAITEPTEK